MSFTKLAVKKVGMDSVVSIPTRYGAGQSGDQILVRARFFRTRPEQHASQPNLQWNG